MRKFCKFVWTTKVGGYNPVNHTLDGAIGLLAESKADLFIRYVLLRWWINSIDSVLLTYNYLCSVFHPSLSPLRAMQFGMITNELVDYIESPKNVIDVLSFQFIQPRRPVDPDKDQSLMNLLHFLLPSTELALIVLAGLLLCSAIWLAIKHLRRWHMQVSILILLYLWFTWMIDVLYNSSLNTASLSVDISDILYSKQQILRTQKESCFLESNSVEVDYYKSVRFVVCAI